MGAPEGRSNEVRLVVPATPEFLRLVRVTAAGLASRINFTFDEVDDLRLATDELCFGLTGLEGRPGTVHVRFLIGDNRLEVEGEGHFDDGNHQVHLSDWSTVILRALVDEHEFWPGPPHPGFRMIKRCAVR
jgi:hypothetical protein